MTPGEPPDTGAAPGEIVLLAVWGWEEFQPPAGGQGAHARGGEGACQGWRGAEVRGGGIEESSKELHRDRVPASGGDEGAVG